MFFDNWYGLGRIIIVGTLAYASIVFSLRLFGKRTLAKMNAFDLVVTVALGSTLATVLLTKDVALLEGVLAFALLALLQFLVAWLSVRSRRWRGFVSGQARLLFYAGRPLEDAMTDERITLEEVTGAIRAHGIARIEEVHAVVLETDGSLSVLGSLPPGETATALQGVQGFSCRAERTGSASQ